MTSRGFTLFDTSIGRCGIAWGREGIVAVQLPEGRDAETRQRLLQRLPDATEAAPPPDVQRVIEGVLAVLRGEAPDLSAAALDMDGLPDFHRRVYEMARTIPLGDTLSYGELAARLGDRSAARAVGQALGRNPFAIVVPCHRVLAAGGKVGGFSANGGTTTKVRLLSLERRQVRATSLFDGDGTFGFDTEQAVAHLRGCDAPLARLIDAVGPFRMRLKGTSTIFAALAESIVYQQLSGGAAATIFARVCAMFPSAHEGLTPQRILRASEETLRGAGLSRSKALSLRDLAQKVVDRRLPTLGDIHRMDDETIIERLTEVRGIGRWTAEMLLMFRLGRPDVLPVDDYGIRKGFAVAFRKRELPTRLELEKRGARWRPYRTVASWYLWRALEL